tara:strand:+ start:7486 stop:8058 length:573 start_codon:yes stop_codon:yes gene_type:complete
MSLAGFVEKILDRASDLEQIKNLKDFKGPQTVPTFDHRVHNGFYHKPVAAEPEFIRLQHLKADLLQTLALELGREKWEVSGRYKYNWKVLRPEDIEVGGTRILSNQILPFDKIGIRLAPEKPLVDRIKFFIEDYCKDRKPKQRGGPKKETIEQEAEAVFGKNISSEFLAAWAAANVDKKWKASGPPSGSG